MNDTALVTGVNGFVGPHLVRELRAHGYDVVGLSQEPGPRTELATDLADYLAVDLVAGPPSLPDVDAVVHLAGLSAVGPSFEDPQGYITANTAMTTSLCAALQERGSRARVLVVSTGAVYDPAQSMPIDERGRTTPTSPYVVSKLAVESIAAYYARRGLSTVVGRPFNHVGPGQGSGFLVPDLFTAVAHARDTGAAVPVGNLATSRDYTDVRDVAAAYRLLLEADVEPGSVFNVCSGRAVSGEILLKLVTELLGSPSVRVELDTDRVRPNDPPLVEGDPSALRRATGWTATRSLESTLADILVSRSDG
ncbi:NAD-dependent epimerase/dehydratase family protein [Nocardioides sp. Root140]|uniref:NAD-dependent epimerase/dehydratase family protein n=1 Tax=Nocardioides sp. Root140 TaxID=1736460 RepID=UPI0006FC944D|nr:NAD-dependent epimerase/dehydratase family protein [Nocardioides sp. Root140]KQY55568.1 hypothetical protein ASD30_16905 [Nocardioides sp. Root140]